MLASLGEAIARRDLDPARAMITQAVRRLDAREGMSAEVEMRLRRRVARLAYQAGNRDAGEACAERAWTLCQQLYPREHEETARCLVQLGWLAESRRDIPRAEALDREAAELFERTLGADSLETALAINNLGCVLNDAGKLEEAMECHRRALAIRTRIAGASSDDVVMSLRNIGNTHRVMGNLEQAEASLQEALRVALLGEASPERVEEVRFNLGRLRLSQKRYAEAEEAFRGLLAREGEARGERTFLGARYRTYVATALEGLGRSREAADELERAAAGFMVTVGPTHSYTYGATRRLGRLLQGMGEPASAEGPLREAMRLSTGLDPADPGAVVSSKETLAKCLRELGRVEEASRLEAQAKADRAEMQRINAGRSDVAPR